MVPRRPGAGGRVIGSGSWQAEPVTEIRVLNAGQVEELLDPIALEEALAEAMVALSEGRAHVPPRSGTEAADGLLLAMPGYLEGVGLATKLISLFPGNVGLPSHQGLIALFEPDTGTPIAVLDAEVISAVRTAVTARLAAGLLARPDARVLTIVGGGAQALAHARAFADLRPWTEVRAVNRSQPAAVRVAAAARDAGVARAEVVELDGGSDGVFDGALSRAVADADVVALCTHADQAVIDAAAIPAGCHVSSVGSRAELPPELAGAGAGPVVVEWRGAVTNPPPAGAAELQHLDPSSVVELGELLVDGSLGRGNEAQITVYKSTGHAVEDVAAAALVHRAAVDRGVGTVVTL